MVPAGETGGGAAYALALPWKSNNFHFLYGGGGVCFFFSMWGPFATFSLYGSFLTMWMPFAAFFSLWGAFSPGGGPFSPYGGPFWA